MPEKRAGYQRIAEIFMRLGGRETWAIECRNSQKDHPYDLKKMLRNRPGYKI
jgi:hypothetical protein